MCLSEKYINKTLCICSTNTVYECQQLLGQEGTVISQDHVPVTHKHAYLLEVCGDSFILEMPCLLAV